MTRKAFYDMRAGCQFRRSGSPSAAAWRNKQTTVSAPWIPGSWLPPADYILNGVKRGRLTRVEILEDGRLVIINQLRILCLYVIAGA